MQLATFKNNFFALVLRIHTNTLADINKQHNHAATASLIDSLLASYESHSQWE